MLSSVLLATEACKLTWLLGWVTDAVAKVLIGHYEINVSVFMWWHMGGIC